MRASKAEQKSLIALLTRMCEETAALEAAHGLTVSERDLRPRIEYFHDAVRVFTSSNEAEARRLSLEYLAYDMEYLRHIQATPIPADKKPRGLSSMELAHLKVDLAEQYKNYAVIYSALFSETADRDFKDRVEDMDNAVENLADIQAMIEQLAAGKASAKSVMNRLAELGDKELLAAVKQMLEAKAKQQKQLLQAAMHRISQLQNAKDKQIEKLDGAHMSYLAAQMYVYEDAKSTVKKLAAMGLNIAGKFVEASVQDVQRGQGQSRGR